MTPKSRNAVIEPIMAEVCFVLLCRPSLPNGWIEVGQWPLVTEADIRRNEGNDRVADETVVQEVQKQDLWRPLSLKASMSATKS